MTLGPNPKKRPYSLKGDYILAASLPPDENELNG